MARALPGSLPRRRLAAGSAALLGLAGTGAAAPADAASPDAELIQLCAAFDALEREFQATDFNSLPYTPAAIVAEAEQDRLTAAQQPYLDRICACRPTTLAGAMALASTLVSLDPENIRQHAARGYTPDRLMLALLYGLTGRT